MSFPLKDGRCFVIAEAGTAHASYDPVQRFEKALRLVRAASAAGADAVKFQWFAGRSPEEDRQDSGILSDMFCRIDGDQNREPRWQASILGPGHWAQIKAYAEACGLVFLASAFQHRTTALLTSLALAATKVASRAAKAFPYREGLPRPFLISTGMVDVDADTSGWPNHVDVVLLQCEARYPSSTRWKGEEGFSDHSGKPFLGIDAISRGCKLLEVHFMVNPLDAGPDLPACLTVEELKLICQARDYYAAR